MKNKIVVFCANREADNVAQTFRLFGSTRLVAPSLLDDPSVGVNGYVKYLHRPKSGLRTLIIPYSVFAEFSGKLDGDDVTKFVTSSFTRSAGRQKPEDKTVNDGVETLTESDKFDFPKQVVRIVAPATHEKD